MDYYNKIYSELLSLKSPHQAKIYKRFFKCGPGDYGEGDDFLGISVPQTRKLAKKYEALVSPQDISKLLKSKFHEARLLGLILIIHKKNLENDNKKKLKLAHFYLKYKSSINNWDLVDVSAPHVLGPYIQNELHKEWMQLSKSNKLWHKRIAILSTFYLIRQNQFKECFKLLKIYLKEEHDLIHKACGWMLREIYKRDPQKASRFIERHLHQMPRTMLRYAIEKMPKAKRQKLLQT